MAPKRGPRHTWLPDERDALQILFFEYDLNLTGEADAHQIFAHIFPWATAQNLSDRLRDEWRGRFKSGRSPKWTSTHSKAFNAYTVAEQADRARVRVDIVTAAQVLGIALTPIAGAVTLHNAAMATLAATGTGLVPVPVGPITTGGLAMPPPPPPPPPPPAETTPDDSIEPPTESTTTAEAPVEDDKVLYMVHYSQGTPNENAFGVRTTGLPRFSWNHSQKFGTESPIWHRGGLVVRALITASGNRSRRIEDVMICRASQCEVCLAVDDQPPLSDRGSSEETNGYPFVHTRACVDFDGLSFESALSTPEGQVAQWGFTEKQVTYFKGLQSFPMTSAVCVRETCLVCNTAAPRTSIPFDGSLYLEAAPSMRAAGRAPVSGSGAEGQDTGGQGQKRGNDGTLEGPGPKRRKAVLPLSSSGNALLEPGRANDLERKLCMVHCSDLRRHVDSAGQQIPGQPLYTTDHRHVFGSPHPMWRRGGMAVNVFIPGGRYGDKDFPDADYHVMRCQRRFCAKCLPVGQTLLTTAGAITGLPAVHRNDCETISTGLVFTPHWSTRAPSLTNSPKSWNEVTFYEAGMAIKVRSMACHPSTCTGCTPTTGNPPARARDDIGLRMVHRARIYGFNHRTLLESADYACQMGDTFDHTKREWHRGGPVIKVYIPSPPALDDATSQDDDIDPIANGAVWDLMICQLGSCQECSTGEQRPYRHYRQPFVHTGSCRTPFTTGGVQVFGPVDLATRDEVIDSEVRYENVVYRHAGPMSGFTPTPIMSAVCVPARCSICSPTLQMVHWNDIDSNLDNGGNVVQGRPMWTTSEIHLFGGGTDDRVTWLRGGPVISALVKALNGGPSMERHLMTCDRAHCGSCERDGAMTGPSPFGGMPFIHARECNREATGFSYTPLQNSDSLELTLASDYFSTIDTTTTRFVTFSLGSSQIAVTAVVCNAAICTVCAAEGEQLQMVHVSDLMWVDGPRASGLPAYQVYFGDIFDQSTPEVDKQAIFRLGGPVIEVSVPGAGAELGGGAAARPDANHHIMICDWRDCDVCKASGTDGIKSDAMSSGNFFRGVPYVHRADCVETPDRLIYGPSRRRWNNASRIGGITAPANVDFFVAGRTITQRSFVCQPKSCPLCNPLDANILNMVHRRNMVPNTLALRPGKTDDYKVRFQCTREQLLGRNEPEWHQGGPVMKVFVPGPPQVDVFDVMVCQFDACNSCRPQGAVARQHTVHRTPFVHRDDCDMGLELPDPTFDPRDSLPLDTGVVCRVQQQLVNFRQRGLDDMTVQPVMSSVCVDESCTSCLEATDASDSSSPDPPSDPSGGASPSAGPSPPSRTNRRTRSQTTTGGGVPTPTTTTAPSGTRARAATKAATKSSTTASKVTGTRKKILGVAAPVTTAAGNTLRMCHVNHIRFDPVNNTVAWRQELHDAWRGQDEDVFFVPQGTSAYKYGGPVYRVNFPNGTTEDVMLCTKSQCRRCNKHGKEAVLPGVTSGDPFCHRGEVPLGMPPRTFVPSPPFSYNLPTAAMQMDRLQVVFPQASKTTWCRICRQGTCLKCG